MQCNTRQEISQKQTETITKVKAVENNSAVSSTSVQTSVLSEIQQQDARKTNIVIIYNLEESTSDEGSTRKDHDLDQVRSILSTIGLSENINIADDISTPR